MRGAEYLKMRKVCRESRQTSTLPGGVKVGVDFINDKNAPLRF